MRGNQVSFQTAATTAILSGALLATGSFFLTQGQSPSSPKANSAQSKAKQGAGVKQTAKQAPASKQGTPQSDIAQASATVNRYCMGCHNATVKTAGIVLNPASMNNVAANAEVWEKAVRQLRAEAMPPAGVPRPDAATYKQIATFLETSLDRAASVKRDVGELPHLHRLTRTEYQNAIRDLLGLDNLPKELEYSLLLPADNSSSGFDNLADLLYVSPVVMERYLDTAKKISRIAVGDPEMPVMVNIHRVPLQSTQDERVEELPFGTRGGMAIHSYFPLDAVYSFRIETAGGGREQHSYEITVDGESKETVTLGAAGGRGGGRGATGPPEYRVAVKAGPHLIGVTFVQRNEALDENTLQPRMRSRGTMPAIAAVTIRGPFEATGPGDTPSRQKLFLCQPKTTAEETGCARQILANLIRRGYRRAETPQDVNDLMPFYEAGRKEKNFDFGVQRALERLLVSPQFLYRIERDPSNAVAGSTYRISDNELASRLSFFLWSSIPDDELLGLANSGRLKDNAVLEQQVRRMLADPRSESMVTNFAAQWLFLRDIRVKEPDLFLFRDFDETLRTAMERETELFVDSVMREDRSVLDLLTANYTFLDERLAKHYGIPNVRGSQFRKVTFPPGSPRGGLLGQGSILTVTSYSTRTSPVLRGKYVLENLLAAPPPPPPPNIPALKTEGKNPDEVLSMRDAMTLHRANPACASCHARMDPIGFAMENFDAIGRWRDKDLGNPIDVSATLTDGTKFTGMPGLRQILLSKPERFVNATTEKLMMYAIGRNVQYYDAPAIRDVVRAAAKDNYKFSTLVVGIVKSAPFQMRQVKPAATVAAR